MAEDSFAARLNKIMALRGMKQIDFVHEAERYDVKLGKSHMSQYVSGKTVPRSDIAHFLAAVLRVNEQWLMGEDVPMEHDIASLPERDERTDSVPPTKWYTIWRNSCLIRRGILRQRVCLPRVRRLCSMPS